MFGRPSIKLIESQGPARRGMQLHLPPRVWTRKQRRAAAALTAGPPPRGLINGYSIPDTQIIKLNFPRGLIQILGGWWMVVIQYSIYPFSSVYCMHVCKISHVANFSLLPNQISDGRCFIWIAQHFAAAARAPWNLTPPATGLKRGGTLASRSNSRKFVCFKFQSVRYLVADRSRAIRQTSIKLCFQRCLLAFVFSSIENVKISTQKILIKKER